MTKEDKLELTRKIGLFGLSDLRKLAPIGDLGYMNGWYYGDRSWMKGGLEIAIMNAYHDQYKANGYKTEGYTTGYRRTDHHSFCRQLGLSWAVDSSD